MSDAFVVELTPRAADDLRALHAYVSSHASRPTADRLLDTLVDRFSALDHFPMRGSLPKELEAIGNDEFRQQVVGKYRVFYRIDARRFRIVLIADGRRDMKDLLSRRLLLTPPDSPR
jgi:toxin ParE1/3/4